MSRKQHWEKVYSTNPIEKMGWYEPHLQTPLASIERLNLAPDPDHRRRRRSSIAAPA